jgi:hypothetical protein
MKRSSLPALTVSLVVLLAASCGDITNGGLDRGEVRTIAIGDSQAPGASSLAGKSESPPGGEGAATGASLVGAQTGAAARGTISFSAEVTLIPETGSPVRLTTTPASATVRIEGTDFATLAVRQVPVGRYSTVRVVFSSVAADVEGGLIVNGLPFLGPLSVNAGAAGSLTIESAMQLDVEPRFSSTLLIDLRASSWLPAVDLLSRTVPGTTFRSAVRLHLQ